MLSAQADVDKRTAKVLLAEGKGLPVVGESFVDACLKAGKKVVASVRKRRGKKRGRKKLDPPLAPTLEEGAGGEGGGGSPHTHIWLPEQGSVLLAVLKYIPGSWSVRKKQAGA